MNEERDNTWAAAAWRAAVRRAAISLAAGLERQARRFMAADATKMEGAEAMELARKLRSKARKVGP